MRTTQNPYSVYDLLGYLIPGLLSILGTSLIFENDFSKGHLTEGFWKSINIEAFSVNHIVPLLIIAYLTGHLLSYLSAMTVEKFSIWSIGYPTEYLLHNIKNNQQKKSLFKFEFLKRYFTPEKIQNYVALYGFNRNICLMFVSFFWFVAIKCIIENQFANHVFILVVFMLFSLIFYAAFNKFFRRYSLEVIMAFSTNWKEK